MIFRYTILYVEDVAASLAFYERAFAMERGFLHESGDYGELVTGATKLAFSSVKLMRTLGKTPGKPAPETPVFEIAFETVAIDWHEHVKRDQSLMRPAEPNRLVGNARHARNLLDWRPENDFRQLIMGMTHAALRKLGAKK